MSGTKQKQVIVAAALAAAGLLGQQLNAATYNWNTASGTVWTTNANWQPNTGNPNAVSDVANINFNITSDLTISLNGNKTVGILNIGDTNTDANYSLDNAANV